MSLSKASFVGGKCVMRLRGQICQSAEELLGSVLFSTVFGKFIRHLRQRKSCLLAVFGGEEADGDGIGNLINALKALSCRPIADVRKQLPSCEHFLNDPVLLNDFVEELYNYWRNFERFLLCCGKGSYGQELAAQPYRVFNDTAKRLEALVLDTYRDLQENITGHSCNIFREVAAGCQVGLIAVQKDWPCPAGPYEMLKDVPVIQRMLLNSPIVMNPPANVRRGEFKKVKTNPLDGLNIEPEKWLCYPAKVGSLLIHIFFNETFIDLGCSLANLFALAEDADLKNKPDAVYVFGASGDDLSRYGSLPTVFFEDEENGLLAAAVPGDNEFGYFGYLKKMVLTLHNVVMMKRGRMPYHGAMVDIVLKNGSQAAILLIGDTGAGKSETLEAFRLLGGEYIRDLAVIADDMGSLAIGEDGEILGYGTEIGAFVRLDDLAPGYAFGQIDRSIIMNAHKVNARAVLPVTTMDKILKGYKVDFIFYANNYDPVDAKCGVLERFSSSEDALKVFREGRVMAKGTTTATGVGSTYFANIFGPPQYQVLHDELADKFFQAAFAKGVFVGQLRTQLGVPGKESTGPQESAKALFELISQQKA